MAKSKVGTQPSKKLNAVSRIKAQALTSTTDAALSEMIGSGAAVPKMPGLGGEASQEAGTVRVKGRDYATSAGVVPAAEIYFVQGAKPSENGPWLGEADKVTWLDPVTRFECIMMRDRDGGFLSGYVGVPSDHPLFGWECEAIPVDLGIEVHGGLTYSRICQDGPSPRLSLVTESRRICHVVIGTAPIIHATGYRAHPDAWWFGFDCNHIYDIVPKGVRDRHRFMGPETAAEYRDDAYVVREILNLATQLRAVADDKPPPKRNGPPLPPIGLDPQRGG